jgi:hypothetical protein
LSWACKEAENRQEEKNNNERLDFIKYSRFEVEVYDSKGLKKMIMSFGAPGIGWCPNIY